MPRFSIVIPTFNRAHLLPLAVRSVLGQSFENYEIVISNGGSTDNTSEVVRSFNDPRIRYIESASRLSISENYQQGLDSSSGEYVTFLSDDDAYTQNLLYRVNDVISETDSEIVGYQYCRYYHDDSRDFEIDIPRNSLLVPSFDSVITSFSAIEALENVLSLHALSSLPPDPRFVCPYLSNATYHRSIFDKLRRRRRNLFDMVPADIYLAAAVFFEANSYACLDEPLLVWSNWEGNTTATAARTEDRLTAHDERLLNGQRLEHTPLKFALALNCGANAVLEAMYERDHFDNRIDWVTYFVKTYENFIFLKGSGVDTSEQENEFAAVLSCQPTEISQAVHTQLSNMKFRIKAFLNSRIPNVAAGLRRLAGRGSDRKSKLKHGSLVGFSNILEASRNVV